MAISSDFSSKVDSERQISSLVTSSLCTSGKTTHALNFKPHNPLINSLYGLFFKSTCNTPASSSALCVLLISLRDKIASICLQSISWLKWYSVNSESNSVNSKYALSILLSPLFSPNPAFKKWPRCLNIFSSAKKTSLTSCFSVLLINSFLKWYMVGYSLK